VPTEPLLHSGRPELTVGGVPDADLAASVLALRVHDGLEGPAGLELEVGAWGEEGFLRRPGIGAELAVQAVGARLFAGRVTAEELVFEEGRAPTLVLLAEDVLQPLRMTRRTRTWEAVGADEVVRAVAGEHGLQAQVDLPGPQLDVVAQLNRSDLALLHDLAAAAGGELWADGRTLHAARRPSRATGAPRALRVGSGLRELRVRADLAHQVTEVVCSGWDVRAKTAIEERAGAALAEAEAEGRTGAALLQAVLGPRVEVLPEPVHRADEARALATAELLRRARRFVRARGVVDVPLRVGERVLLEGASRRFSGDYVVVDVRHRFDVDAGFRTEFAAERPAVGEAS
jgi:uncharacterized protein